jgi:adenylate cyclase
MSLDPNNEAANRQLGWTLLFLGEPCAAIARGEKSLRLSPRDPHLSGIYLLLAWSRLVLDRLQEAVDLFIKGRIANPRVWMFSYGLAGALALKGDLDGAKAALAESLKLKPEVKSLAQWCAYLPWTGRSSAPLFWAMQEKTLDNGLRLIGFPEK